MIKKLIIFLILFIALLPTALARIPIIEFNLTKGEQTIFSNLPHRYQETGESLFGREGQTLIIDVNKLVNLPKWNLTLSVDHVEGVFFDIDQASRKVKITPASDWFGEAEIKIYVNLLDQSQISKVIELGDVEVFLEGLELDKLNNFFDDTLYGIFTDKLTTLVELRKEVDYDVEVTAVFKEDILEVDVGEDVIIITSFKDTNVGKRKPEIIVTLVGESVKSIGIYHCTDGLQNYNEEGVDCGGICKECKKSFNYNLLLPIIVIVGILIIILFNLETISYFLSKIVKRRVKEKVEIRRFFLTKLSPLKEKLTEKNVEFIFTEFTKVVREFFKEVLNIKYKFTYEELKSELEKRRVNKKIKSNALLLFRKISKMSYSDYQITKQELLVVIKEAESIIERMRLRRKLM